MSDVAQKVDVICLFPQIIESVISCGVTGGAVEKKLLEVKCWNPRDYTEDRHRTVDDKPYGGGPGMVLMAKPLSTTLEQIKKQAGASSKVIYMSPQGQAVTQPMLQGIINTREVIIIAGRYEGIDERFIDAEVDEEWSLGDYVLSGGELAAAVVIDAIARLLPGAVGDSESVQQDSFMQGLLDYPQYSRPKEFQGCEIPKVLLSGDHEAIRRWRLQQSLIRTFKRRPDLLQMYKMSTEEQGLLDEFLVNEGK